MKKIIFLFLIIGVVLVSGCAKKPEILGSSNINIELKAAGWWPPTLTIDNNGNAIYTRGSFRGDDINYTSTSKISREELETLANFIVEKGFFSMKDEYKPKEELLDLVAKTIKATINDKTKTVICLYDCPKEFYEITNKIIETWGGNFEITGWA